MTPPEREGLFHLYHGPGKGKTTAAIGAVTRAAGHDLSARVLQFFKGGDDRYAAEARAMRSFEGVELDRYPTSHVRDADELTETETATLREGLADAENVLRDGAAEMVVLDEVTLLWAFDAVPAERLVGLLEAAADGVEVVLTGRSAPDELVEAVHYCSYVGAVKHPYRRGIEARPGVEY
jgi:cob(I)alamin adenosyltransferase